MLLDSSAVILGGQTLIIGKERNQIIQQEARAMNTHVFVILSLMDIRGLKKKRKEIAASQTSDCH